MQYSHPNKHYYRNYVPADSGTQNYSPTNIEQNCSLLPHRNSRPQSTDLTERIPNNKFSMDRSVSNFVECEDPKFIVRNSYREKRDKKSESWVPSFV